MTQIDNLTLELTEQIIDLKNDIVSLQNLISEAKLSNLSNTLKEIENIGVLDWLDEDLEITKQTLEVERKMNSIDTFFNRINDVKERYLILKTYYLSTFLNTAEETESNIDNQEEISEEKNDFDINDKYYLSEKRKEEVKEDLSKKSDEELRNMYGYSEFKKD